STLPQDSPAHATLQLAPLQWTSPHEPLLHASSSVPALAVTLPEQLLLPEQVRSQPSAVHSMPSWHDSVPEHSAAYVVAPPRRRPSQLWLPLHSTLQATLLEQSIPPPHEELPLQVTVQS